MLVFDDLYSRADESVLQHLLVPSAARLVALLDPKYAAPSRLRPLIADYHTRTGLLLNSTYRSLLFDLLRPGEAQFLAELLNVAQGGDVYARLKAVSFKEGTDKTSRLFSYFELPEPEVVWQERVPAAAEIEPQYPLFKHQRRAVAEVQSALAGPPHRCCSICRLEQAKPGPQ